MKYISYKDQELLSESYNNVKINELIEEASAIYPDASYEELVDILVQENIIGEGIGNILKSRFGQAKGAIQGMGQQIAGRAQQVAGAASGGLQQFAGKQLGNLATAGKKVGNYLGASDPNSPADPNASSAAERAAQNFAQRGADKSSAAQAAGQEKIAQGQIQGQLGKYQTAINTIVKDVNKDLTSLNMPVKDQEAFKKDLFNLLTRHLTQTQKVGKTSGREFVGSSGATGGITRNY